MKFAGRRACGRAGMAGLLDSGAPELLGTVIQVVLASWGHVFGHAENPPSAKCSRWFGQCWRFYFLKCSEGAAWNLSTGGDLFFSLCLLPGLYFWSMQNNVSGLAVFIPWFFSAHFALASCFTNCPMDFAWELLLLCFPPVTFLHSLLFPKNESKGE